MTPYRCQMGWGCTTGRLNWDSFWEGFTSTVLSDPNPTDGSLFRFLQEKMRDSTRSWHQIGATKGPNEQFAIVVVYVPSNTDQNEVSERPAVNARRGPLFGWVLTAESIKINLAQFRCDSSGPRGSSRENLITNAKRWFTSRQEVHGNRRAARRGRLEDEAGACKSNLHLVLIYMMCNVIGVDKCSLYRECRWLRYHRDWIALFLVARPARVLRNGPAVWPARHVRAREKNEDNMPRHTKRSELLG